MMKNINIRIVSDDNSTRDPETLVPRKSSASRSFERLGNLNKRSAEYGHVGLGYRGFHNGHGGDFGFQNGFDHGFGHRGFGPGGFGFGGGFSRGGLGFGNGGFGPFFR